MAQGTRQLSNHEARWLAIEAQGLGRPRPNGRIQPRHLGALVDRIGTVQLDAVNVVERTQFLVLFSRLGAYDAGRLYGMAGPGGELFEYWGHAASLLPVVTQPLFRWRMARHGTDRGGNSKYEAARREWRAAHDGYIESVLEEVRQRGALAASELADPRRRTGEWWERRSTGRLALEWLFAKGQLAAWRTRSFERVYDLPERVLPKDVLAAATPSMEEAQRRLLALAAKSLGVATIGDLADYYRIKPNEARARVAELVEAGELVPVAVEGWRQAAYCLPVSRVRRPSRSHATLLSPFDSLIWERERTERLFGFEYRIEVYVPERQRKYGYYVMPLLVGDEIVGRFDLKADRKASTLRVCAAFMEPVRHRPGGGAAAPTATAGATAAAAADELDRLRSWLGLDALAVEARGDLATALRRAVR